MGNKPSSPTDVKEDKRNYSKNGYERWMDMVGWWCTKVW